MAEIYTTVRILIETKEKLEVIATRNRRSVVAQMAWMADSEYSKLEENQPAPALPEPQA